MGAQKPDVRRRDQQSQHPGRSCLPAPPGVLWREVQEPPVPFLPLWKGRWTAVQTACSEHLKGPTILGIMATPLMGECSGTFQVDVGGAHSLQVTPDPAFCLVHKRPKSTLRLPFTGEDPSQPLKQDRHPLRRPRNCIRRPWVTLEEAFHWRRADKEQRREQAGKKRGPETLVWGSR